MAICFLLFGCVTRMVFFRGLASMCVGQQRLYLTLKALMRANIFVARNAIDANEEAEPLWAVPSLETLEGMEMMSTVLTVVKGPPL